VTVKVEQLLLVFIAAVESDVRIRCLEILPLSRLMPRRIVDVIVASNGLEFSPRRVDLLQPSFGLLQLVL
jgi:hypothetical protein